MDCHDAIADGPDAPLERINVSIRLRPLNARKLGGGGSGTARVWKVPKGHSSIVQTTPLPSEGGILPTEGVEGHSLFSFDRVFGEECTTREIYDGVVGNIVSGAVSGVNGTVFAYGQTSSGKTYTMQGDGADCPGIVNMAAADMFGRIGRCDDGRSYVVRASFIEIYNEEVRDLLVPPGGNSGSRSSLAVREDPSKGVHVECREQVVTDPEGLISALFAGEKNRSVAATAMNETSSRSHAIFRVTVESRPKQKERNGGKGRGDVKKEENGSGFEDGAGTVRISTLNLVDLAGPESVRLTGATGERQKEGGRINRSLLTLSRVISGLGSGAVHVSFRDSKLTRVLQPSLSGNARMAVVCCATPSQMYLEETRSTFQFAERAKLVRTHAAVNEVLDDRAVIAGLRREVAQLLAAAVGETGASTVENLRESAKRAVLNEKEIKCQRDQSGITTADLEKLKESCGRVEGELKTVKDENRGLKEEMEALKEEREAILNENQTLLQRIEELNVLDAHSILEEKERSNDYSEKISTDKPQAQRIKELDVFDAHSILKKNRSNDCSEKINTNKLQVVCSKCENKAFNSNTLKNEFDMSQKNIKILQEKLQTKTHLCDCLQKKIKGYEVWDTSAKPLFNEFKEELSMRSDRPSITENESSQILNAAYNWNEQILEIQQYITNSEAKESDIVRDLKDKLSHVTKSFAKAEVGTYALQKLVGKKKRFKRMECQRGELDKENQSPNIIQDVEAAPQKENKTNHDLKVSLQEEKKLSKKKNEVMKQVKIQRKILKDENKALKKKISNQSVLLQHFQKNLWLNMGKEGGMVEMVCVENRGHVG